MSAALRERHGTFASAADQWAPPSEKSDPSPRAVPAPTRMRGTSPRVCSPAACVPWCAQTGAGSRVWPYTTRGLAVELLALREANTERRGANDRGTRAAVHRTRRPCGLAAAGGGLLPVEPDVRLRPNTWPTLTSLGLVAGRARARDGEHSRGGGGCTNSRHAS